MTAERPTPPYAWRTPVAPTAHVQPRCPHSPRGEQLIDPERRLGQYSPYSPSNPALMSATGVCDQQDVTHGARRFLRANAAGTWTPDVPVLSVRSVAGRHGHAQRITPCAVRVCRHAAATKVGRGNMHGCKSARSARPRWNLGSYSPTITATRCGPRSPPKARPWCCRAPIESPFSTSRSTSGHRHGTCWS